MDRMTLKEEIRQHFDCRDYLRKSSGCSLYICRRAAVGAGSTKPVRSNIIQTHSVGTVTGVRLWVTSLQSMNWNMVSILT